MTRAATQKPEKRNGGRAEYMRRYRAKKAREASCIVIGGASTRQDGAMQEKPEGQEAPVSKPVAPQIDNAKLLADAIGGTVEALADAAQLVWLDTKAPRLGHERAQALGALWAPVLAPYLSEDLVRHLPLLLALGGTSSALYSWAHEYAEFRARAEPKPAAPLPQPPQSEIEATNAS